MGDASTAPRTIVEFIEERWENWKEVSTEEARTAVTVAAVSSSAKASLDWHGSGPASAPVRRQVLNPRIMTDRVNRPVFYEMVRVKAGVDIEVIRIPATEEPSTHTLLFMLPYNTLVTFIVGFMEHLPRSISIVSFHYPGEGLSGYIPMASFADVADLAVELLDCIGVKDPVGVTGASFGGFAAQVLAARHPERVAFLVLQSTGFQNKKKGSLVCF